jgi:hypothetical protein
MRPVRLAPLALLLGLAACSIQAPEIKVTGERSLLEKQVLGSYQSFSRDLWMATSLRGLPDSLSTEGERENLLKAIRRRRFNQDDRLRLLADGWLGEGRDGRLGLRTEGAPAPERELAERVERQENQDREVLLARLRRLYPALEPAELAGLFAAIQRDEAPKGAWLEQADGGWSRK